jgi:predicted kinase
MAQLFIAVIGHNSSGKTTIATQLADKFGLNRISGDDFRHFIYDHIPYFKSMDNSYPTTKNKELNPLVINYRQELAHILLGAGQQVIFDGSGASQEVRTKYFGAIKQKFPEVKTVIVWADLPELELLKRLAERDKTSNARWTEMYHTYKKHSFEPPQQGEADVLLRYDQTNYQDIEDKISSLL